MTRRLVVMMAATTAVVLGAGVAFAAWTSAAAGSATARSTSLLPPAAGSVSASTTGTNSVTIKVNAGPAAPSAPASGYRVDRVLPSPALGVCYIAAVTGSCSDTEPAGNYSYTVSSVIGINLDTATRTVSWISATSVGTVGTVASGPFAAVAVADMTYTKGNSGNGGWNNGAQGCGGSDTICGTRSATAPATVASFTVQLKRTVGSTVTFWNGSAWQSLSTNIAATAVTVSGSNWSSSITYGQLRLGGVSSTATYVITASVTDSNSNSAAAIGKFSTT